MEFILTGALSGDGRIVDAVEKQLGLKLEPRQVATPVIVVDSVDKKPTANPAGIAEAFPMAAPPTEFDVVSVKLIETPSTPNEPILMRTQSQPGGRVNYQYVPLSFLIRLPATPAIRIKSRARRHRPTRTDTT